jgi:aryl-alcohol dehydrogenase-like predicted oxidoreductase
MRFANRTLGRTGVTVGPLGISASYGAPAVAVERAVESGMNYLYWGSVRTQAFAEALRHLATVRDRLVLVVQSFSRVSSVMTWRVERALRSIGYGHADVLLLGHWNKPMNPRILDAARTLQRRGLVNFVAVSSHNRAVAAALAASGDFDIVHVRYNAAHPGAERDFFPQVPAENRPGIVSFTGTSWGQLLNRRYTPPGDRTPTAGDCYRFALSHPGVDVCVTGPASAEHVEQAMAARELGPLSPDEVAWMTRVGAEVRRRAWLGRQA